MKVVCIDNLKRGKLRIGSDSYLPLTIGKIYERKFVGNMSPNDIVDHLYFYLDDDNNKVGSFDSWRFISLEEWTQNQRDEKLNKIL